MRHSTEIWKERPWVWALPLAFVAINLLAFGIYRGRYAGGVEDLERRYQSDAEVLAGLQETVSEADTLFARARQQQEEIDLLYEAHFSTESDRFTDLLREVRSLARAAGLNPSSFSYPETELEEFSLLERRVDFPVQGTYEQLRTFLNLLELSDQFVSLQQVALAGTTTGNSSPVLNVHLSLTTYFRDTGFDPQNPRGTS